jgi:hypothetical protein
MLKMNNRLTPFTSTPEEMDKLLFNVLTAEFNALYPNDTRMALKAAMHVCDNVMTHVDALAARAAKSDQARRAAQARYAGTTPPAIEPAAQAPAAPEIPAAAPFTAPAAAPAPKPPRVRRTKAQIAAGVPLAAVAAQAPAAPAPQTAPQPVPMGAPFTPQEQLFQPAPQPAAAPAPEAPVVTDFAALAKQAASQGVPQFAPPGATPNPAFVPPAPTFG